MRLTLQGLNDSAAWKNANIALPKNDLQKMRETTAKSPKWVHVGAGNIFRGFIASVSEPALAEFTRH